MKTLFATTAAALILSVGAAMAQTPVPGFEDVDTNANGTISWEELSAAFTGDVSEEDFAAADVDGNMELSAEEFATLEIVASLTAQDAGQSGATEMGSPVANPSQDATETDDSDTENDQEDGDGEETTTPPAN